MPFPIAVMMGLALFFHQNKPNVCGKVKMDTAKMMGMTPPLFTFNGRCVETPPIPFRPTIRLAYWVGMRRSPRSTRAVKGTTTNLDASQGHRTGKLHTRGTKAVSYKSPMGPD